MLLKLQSRTARLLSFGDEPTLRRFCTHCGPMFSVSHHFSSEMYSKREKALSEDLLMFLLSLFGVVASLFTLGAEFSREREGG